MPEGSVVDALDESIGAGARESMGLVSYGEALRGIHRPATFGAATAARRRLAFDELFLLEVAMLRRRAFLQARKTEDAEVCEVTDTRGVDRLAEGGLPWALTGAQQRVLADILGDLSGPFPMRRLLQGDVGSGKTVVAMLALLAVAGTPSHPEGEGNGEGQPSSWQGALMAPTEVRGTR